MMTVDMAMMAAGAAEAVTEGMDDLGVEVVAGIGRREAEGMAGPDGEKKSGESFVRLSE